MSPPAEACPICGKPPAKDFAPFCSKRCADIDLGRWLKGGYAIPGEKVPDSDGGAGAGEPDPEKA